MSNPLPRLRTIRKLESKAEKLKKERDRLVREAGANYTEGQIAKASGLSQTRVHEILNGDQ